jgi:predicted O-methyltransferase YrrM
VHGETDQRKLILPAISSAVTPNESEALADLARGKTVLEMGAWYGYSTIVLASVAERVTSVDWHMGDDHAGTYDTWEIFSFNIIRYGVAARVEAIRERFEDILPQMAEQGRKFDGCFLDAHHSEESVTRDIGLALPLLNHGAFMAFHDYGRGPHNGFPGFGVTEAADRFGIEGRTGFLGWGFVK